MPPEEPGYLELRKRPATDDPAEFWAWVVESIQVLNRYIPLGEEPEHIYWQDPDEWHKEQWEREAKEEEDAPRVVECLGRFLQKGQWPRSKATVAFFARERMEFAERIAAALATKPHAAAASGVAPIPKGGLGATIRWLAIDVYDAGHFGEKRWTRQSRGRFE